jgi:hypothetical protein
MSTSVASKISSLDLQNLIDLDTQSPSLVSPMISVLEYVQQQTNLPDVKITTPPKSKNEVNIKEITRNLTPVISQTVGTPKIDGMVKIPKIIHRFTLGDAEQDIIRNTPYKFGFGGFGEAVYYRTYSRLMENGTQEQYPDTVIRVVNGVMSIRKDWYIKHGIQWDNAKWQSTATKMGISMMKMHFLPPGRGLWACGSDYMYERGSAALNNCGFTSTTDLLKATVWTADMLMCGCGIGFDCSWEGEAYQPLSQSKTHLIHDSREGWAESIHLLMNSYLCPNKDNLIFDYSSIRPYGSPIKGFGGTASGPGPLIQLHNRIRAYFTCFIACQNKNDPYQAIKTMVVNLEDAATAVRIIDQIDVQKHFCDRLSAKNTDITIDEIKSRTDWFYIRDLIKSADKDVETIGIEDIYSILEQRDFDYLMKYANKSYDRTRLVVDIFNAIGCCVVAGNVRRSSEIALGKVGDTVFLNLKNYAINPERASSGWMSNNTVVFTKTQDFNYLPLISQRMLENGEPGIYNLINAKRYGRMGRHEHIGRENEEDKAIGLNPCAEICLESMELCNLSEVFIPRCQTNEELTEAFSLATLYASTVSLLPTHWSWSNAVIARNRRIGVSISGLADEYDRIGFTKLVRILRDQYRNVRAVNAALAEEAGVPSSIRVTTIKPSGSISQLVGVSSGVHFPTFRYAIRRMRVAGNAPIVPVLKAAGYPFEEDVYSKGSGTLVFSFPIDQGKTRSAEEVTVWEQMSMSIAFQREWADNSVSQTIYVSPEKESHMLEIALAQTVPMVKSISVLPHIPAGVYAQSPYEKVNKEEYLQLCENVKQVDWNTFSGDGEIDRYCSSDTCEIASFKAKSP